MKIIIKRESGKVTLETCEGSYPYQVRELIKNALMLEGYAKGDIAEIMNIQEDKVQPCCAEEGPSEATFDFENYTCMVFGDGEACIPVIVNKISGYVDKELILNNVTGALNMYGKVGYKHLPVYDRLSNKDVAGILEALGHSMYVASNVSKFSNMEVFIYPEIYTLLNLNNL